MFTGKELKIIIFLLVAALTGQIIIWAKAKSRPVEVKIVPDPKTGEVPRADTVIKPHREPVNDKDSISHVNINLASVQELCQFEIILDDGDADVAFSGSWIVGAGPGGFGGEGTGGALGDGTARGSLGIAGLLGDGPTPGVRARRSDAITSATVLTAISDRLRWRRNGCGAAK